jgi:hypothetical protein
MKIKIRCSNCSRKLEFTSDNTLSSEGNIELNLFVEPCQFCLLDAMKTGVQCVIGKDSDEPS